MRGTSQQLRQQAAKGFGFQFSGEQYRPSGGTSGNETLYGKPTSAFSSGTTVTLDPCDIHGTDNGDANIAVYLQADQSSYSMTNSTTIATSMIVHYTIGDDGNAYVLGFPRVVITAFNVDNTNFKLQYKIRHVWGAFCGTESAYIDATTGDTC